jgi:hypothetical protein
MSDLYFNVLMQRCLWLRFLAEALSSRGLQCLEAACSLSITPGSVVYSHSRVSLDRRGPRLRTAAGRWTDGPTAPLYGTRGRRMPRAKTFKGFANDFT